MIVSCSSSLSVIKGDIDRLIRNFSFFEGYSNEIGLTMDILRDVLRLISQVESDESLEKWGTTSTSGSNQHDAEGVLNSFLLVASEGIAEWKRACWNGTALEYEVTTLLCVNQRLSWLYKQLSMSVAERLPCVAENS